MPKPRSNARLIAAGAYQPQSKPVRRRRHLKVSLHAHRLVHDMFNEIDRRQLSISEVSRRSGYGTKMFYDWAAARTTPRAVVLADIAEAIGGTLRFEFPDLTPTE